MCLVEAKVIGVMKNGLDGGVRADDKKIIAVAAGDQLSGIYYDIRWTYSHSDERDS